MKKIKVVLILVICALFMSVSVLAEEYEKGYEFGTFMPDGINPVDLGVSLKGKILFEYDLHVPENISHANNAIVFGGDSMNSWASVGAALYINNGWNGSGDVFYTQDSDGSGTGRVVNSSLGWKKVAGGSKALGFTTYHVETVIDTREEIASGYGVYEIYMTPEGGERQLITVNGYHGFRTGYEEITKIGVWTNGGNNVWISNLTAEYLEGDTYIVNVNYIVGDEIVTSHSFLRGVGESFDCPVEERIKYNGKYYVPSDENNLTIDNLSDNIAIDVHYEADYSGALYSDYEIECEIKQFDNKVYATFDILAEEYNGEELLAGLLIKGEDNLIKKAATKIITLDDDMNLQLEAFFEDMDESHTVVAMLWRKKNMEPLIIKRESEVVYRSKKGFTDLNNVRLEDGIFKTSQEVGLDYVLSMDVDRLLAPSFEMAGLSVPNGKTRYAGWEGKGVHGWGGSNFTLAGHSLGHWLSAAAVLGASTGNEEVLENLSYAVEMLQYIQETKNTGYIGGVNESCFTSLFGGNVSSWSSGYWVPWYGIHKIYQGLIDAYTYTGNEKALEVVIRFSDWAYEGTKNLSDSQMQTMLGVEYGGMNDSFAQLYEITGDEKYLVMARRFTHDKILNPLINGKDELTGLHANTQIPKIIGTAEIYEQDNEAYESYKLGAKFFWDTIVNNRSYVIGGNSIGEHFEALGLESLGVKTCESCNTYNMLKLTEHLFDWEHNSSYMDYYETALYNHILGQQDPETGNKMYFISTLQGHYRIYGTAHDSFWCCTGTGMENPGRYGKVIYYEDGEEVYVNLYIPSNATLRNGMELKIDTNYPYSDKIDIAVNGNGKSAKLMLRVPSWAKSGATATVGDETYTMDTPGYMEIERVWEMGDMVELVIPMELNMYTSREGNVAFTYGPVALAAPLGDEGLPTDTVVNETGLDTTTTDVPFLVYEGNDVNELVKIISRDTLNFEIDGQYTSTGKNITLIPFYEIHHQFHNIYWNLNEEGDAFMKALNDASVDAVQPDGQQDEIGHKLLSLDSHNGSFTSGGSTYMWRDAWGSDGSFASGGKSYARDFIIYVDDVEIAEEVLNKPSPGNVYHRFYEIPAYLTEGKDTVTVKMQARNASSCAGGVLEMRITKEIVEG